uniref:Wall-associated receptor kinase C-terminal domain-containing protein n=1 Tax=Rhizophora mucronata TaxID=61149 RepID=A0A2P2N0J5_RHIMU
MSACTSMHPSTNLGLDWASPFQLGPSTLVLLGCPAQTSSLTIKGSPVCDASSSYLCASIYTCPAVIGLGLPLFPPTNTCCVYSPANLNSKGELDLGALKCMGYTSVVSFRDYPTDPTRWEYGVVLKYKSGAFDDYYMDSKCNTCESSGGLCGYAPPGNSFVCLCKNGINSTTDCNGYTLVQGLTWNSSYLPSRNLLLGILAGLVVLGMAY